MNTIGVDCQDIIYKNIHKMNMLEVLDELTNERYSPAYKETIVVKLKDLSNPDAFYKMLNYYTHKQTEALVHSLRKHEWAVVELLKYNHHSIAVIPLHLYIETIMKHLQWNRFEITTTNLGRTYKRIKEIKKFQVKVYLS